VQPSLIRVDADEVTYPAHVIFRYKLEKAMIEGKLEVEDLPAAWEAEIQALLGVKPNTDKDGCMQDIHWYSGAFGYFPTYAFGAITAAQLFNTAKRAHPGLLSEIAAGNLKTLIAWLDSNVYSYGSKFRANELIKQATGKFIGVEDYIANLQKRYLG
jgi:carboxypeptidase Taq